ncbi:unnamed protein product, partial [marine sediment metagenome]
LPFTLEEMQAWLRRDHEKEGRPVKTVQCSTAPFAEKPK